MRSHEAQKAGASPAGGGGASEALAELGAEAGESRRAQEAALAEGPREFSDDGERVDQLGEGGAREFSDDGEQVNQVGEGGLREGEGGDADGGSTPAAEEGGVTKVTVSAEAATIDLLKRYTLTATSEGDAASVQAEKYTFEYRPAAGGSWTTLQDGPEATCAGVARIAGEFRVRVTADGTASEELAMTVRFPPYADIVANADVRAACDAAWSETKAATTATTRREQAFWVRLDTAGDGSYSASATIVGPTRTNDQGASVQPLPKPADVDNGDTRVYTVACFHTHTPMTHRYPPDYDAATDAPKWSRPVGPSAGDVTFHNHNAVSVPGIVYDYSATAVSGHDIDAPAQLYHVGPTRRDLPTP